jgi:hypothetical protein
MLFERKPRKPAPPRGSAIPRALGARSGAERNTLLYIQMIFVWDEGKNRVNRRKAWDLIRSGYPDL